MRFLLRPFVAISTFTVSLLMMSICVAFDDEASGEGPYIINNTEALEVIGLTKSLDRYQLWLKNNSGKNVVAYRLTVGNSDLNVHGRGYGNRHPVIVAGETYQEEHLQGKNLESTSITIRVVVFDDESFEGDVNLAAQFVARREGIRIQSSPVLQMIDRTLEVDEAKLLSAFDELETQLEVMPEAISKSSALEVLRSKYPCFDKKMIGSLYEDLKAGLYEAKNMAHSPVGNLQRHIKGLKDDSTIQGTLQAKVIREKLNEIKKNFGGLSEIR